MSCTKEKEQKTNSLCLGESPREGNPSHPPCVAPGFGNSHTLRNAKLSRQNAKMGRQNEAPEWGRGGGGNSATFQITQQWSNISRCFFHTKMCIPFPLLIAVSNCAHLLYACCKEESGALYSEAEPINRRQNWSPALRRLHSIIQATSLRRTVYTRTKLATTTHVE